MTGPAYRLEVRLSEDNQEVQTNFEFMATAGIPIAGEEAALITAFDAANFGAMAACFCLSTVIHGYKVTCLSDITRIPVYGAALTGTGTVVGPHINMELAAIMRKYTAHKGQHGEGRNYLPAIPLSFVSTAINPNVINGVGSGFYAAFMASVLAPLTVGLKTFQLAICTRPATNINYTLGAPVTSAQATALMGTQRRRRIGRGK